ncbi:MAG: HNH endonuclease, partial [Gemmatimonadales bacterium]
RGPSLPLFSLIDRRGARSEEEDQKDQYVTDRMLCAQFLRVFLARERDPYAYPSVSANELDALYHEHTDFDPNGESAKQFKLILTVTGAVVHLFNTKKPGSKSKMRKLDVLSIFMFLADLFRNRLRKSGPADHEKLAQRVVDADGLKKPAGKSTSGSALQNYYEWWREHVGQDFGIILDSRRTFDDAQKQALWDRANGQCGVCGKAVAEADAEYDHFPVPYRDGGATEIDNGRLVHRACHERGRPRGSA